MRTIGKHRPSILSPTHDGELVSSRKKLHASKVSHELKPFRKGSSSLLDEYQLKASKILQVNNLDASVSEEDLLKKFSKFGDIIDVDICPSLTSTDQCEALVQFCDIKSVVHALNYAGDIVIHGRSVELCFGKSQPTNCLWLDKLPERTTESLLNQHFHQFGKVMDVVLDHAFMRALVYFENSSIAQKALKFTKEQYFNGEKVHVDYASYQCQTLFKSRVPVAYSWNSCDTTLEREHPSESTISEMIFGNASVDTRSSWQSPSSIKSPSEGVCMSPIPKLSDSTASPDLSDNLLHEAAEVLSTSSHNQLSFRHLPLSSSSHIPLCYSSASSSSSARHNRHTTYSIYDSATSSSKENIRKKSTSGMSQEQHLRSLKIPLSVNTNVSCGGFENVSSRGLTSPGDESCPSITTSPSRNVFQQSHSSHQRSKKMLPISEQTRRFPELSMLTESNSSLTHSIDRNQSSKRNSSRSSHLTPSLNYTNVDDHESRMNSVYDYSINESMYDKIKRRNSKNSGYVTYDVVASSAADSSSVCSDRFGVSSPVQALSHGKRHKTRKDSSSSTRRDSFHSSSKRSGDNSLSKHNKLPSVTDEDISLTLPPSVNTLKKGFLTVNSVFCTTPPTTDDEENYDRDNAYYYDVPTPSTIHMEGDLASDLADEEQDDKPWHASVPDKRNGLPSEANTSLNEKPKDSPPSFFNFQEQHNTPKKIEIKSDAEVSPKTIPREFPPIAVVSPQRKLSSWTTESFEMLPSKPSNVMVSSPNNFPIEKNGSLSDPFVVLKSNNTEEMKTDSINQKLECDSQKPDSNLCQHANLKMPNLDKEESTPFGSSSEDKGVERSHIISHPQPATYVNCSPSQLPCIPGVNVFSPITTGDVKNSLCPMVSTFSNLDNVSCMASLPGELIMSTLRPAQVASTDSSLNHTESNSSESAPDISSDICTLVPPPSKRSKLSPAMPTTSTESVLRLEETIDSIVKGFTDPLSGEQSLIDDFEMTNKPCGHDDPYALEFMDSPGASFYANQSPDVTSASSILVTTTSSIQTCSGSASNQTTLSTSRGHKCTNRRVAQATLKASMSKSDLDENGQFSTTSIADIIDNVAHGNFDMDWHLNLWRQQFSSKHEESSHNDEKVTHLKKEWQCPPAVSNDTALPAISNETTHPPVNFTQSIPQTSLSVSIKEASTHVSHPISHNIHDHSIPENVSSRTLMNLSTAIGKNSSPSPMSLPPFSLPPDSTALKFGNPHSATLLTSVTPALIAPTISPPVVQLPSPYPFHDISTPSVPYPVFYQSNELIEALYHPFNLPLATDISGSTSTSNIVTEMASALHSASAYGSCGVVTPLLNPLMEDIFNDQNKLAALLSMYKIKSKHPLGSSASTATSLTSSTPPSASCEISDQYNPMFAADSNLLVDGHNIDAEYPLIWQGRLSLKNDDISVNMHHVHGNVNLIDACLLLSGCTLTSKDSENKAIAGPPLKIVQRMRLEASQLEAVGKKMRIEPDHCSCVAVARGSTIIEKLQTNILLINSFIKYMQEKSAAGIINVCHPNSHQGLYVIHIFPPCEFSNTHLYEIAPKLFHQLTKEKIPHLLVVITTA